METKPCICGSIEHESYEDSVDDLYGWVSYVDRCPVRERRKEIIGCLILLSLPLALIATIVIGKIYA